MKLKGKLLEMLGFSSRPATPDTTGPAISQALQRNERASERARAALEDVLSRNERIKGQLRDV